LQDYGCSRRSKEFAVEKCTSLGLGERRGCTRKQTKREENNELRFIHILDLALEADVCEERNYQCSI